MDSNKTASLLILASRSLEECSSNDERFDLIFQVILCLVFGGGKKPLVGRKRIWCPATEITLVFEKSSIF